RVDRRRTRERGAGESRAAGVEENARIALVAAELRGGVRAGDRGGAGAAARGGDAGQIGEAPPRACGDLLPQSPEAEPVHERGQVRECRCRGALALRHEPIRDQIRPFALRKPSATSSGVFLSTSTVALSFAIVSSLSFAEIALSASAIFGFLSS